LKHQRGSAGADVADQKQVIVQLHRTMHFRIQTRIILLISAFTALFLAMLFLHWERERDQLVASLAEREIEQSALLDRVLHLASRSLAGFVYDYTVWDDMCDLVDTGDEAWAEENVVPALRTFDTQAAWVYAKNLTRVYSVNTLNDSTLTDLPITRAEMSALLTRRPFGRFFISTAAGPMEIHCAPIQPSSDDERRTDPHGYLFVGRLWSPEHLQDLSRVSGAELRLGAPSLHRAASSRDPRTFAVTNRIPLPSWNGRPLFELTAVSEDPTVMHSYRELHFFFVTGVVFVSAIMLMIWLFLFRYVTNPLRQITTSLAAQNPSLIPSVRNSNPEFAALAGLLMEFFEQKETLQAEIEQRRQSETALRESEKRFHDLADLLPLIIFETDKSGRITFLSRTAAELLGLKGESESEGLNVLELIAPADRARAKADLLETFANRTPPGLVEYRGLRGDGTTLDLAVDACPILRDGQVCGIRGFAMDASKSKAAIETLRQNRELLHTLIETAPLPICMLDREGRVQDVWNPAAESMFGWKKSEVMGKFALAAPMVTEEARERHRRDFAKLWEGQTLSEVEVTLRDRDGNAVPVSCFATPLRDSDGNVSGVVAILVDLTERRKMEQALRESEERFRNLSDTAPVLIWMAGVDRHCYYFNKTWLAFTGRSLPHEYGKGWTAGVHPDDLAPCLQTYRTAFTARRPFSIEFRLRSATGDYRWMLDHGAPRFTADGGFAGYIGTCTDITDRRDAEEALREEKEKAQCYLDIVGTIVVAINPDETVSLINQAGCRLLGVREEEVCGKNWFDCFLPETARQDVRKVFARLMAGDIEPAEYVEGKVLTHTGQERTVAWRNTVLRDKSGRITATLSSGEDITERPAATHHLETLEREINDSLHRVHPSAEVSGQQDKWKV
jgi:PAS domain S-box-containing protein